VARVVLTNARVFDGISSDCPEGMSVFIDGETICEISATPINVVGAGEIDVGGGTLMPGLIDAHVHAYACDVSTQKIDSAGEPYRTAHAIRMLGFALGCGFTTVRDVAGGDYSLSQAINDGLVRAPRFLYAGKALSMTGGHGDFRQMSEFNHQQGYCSCGTSNALCVIADGIDECIKAAREELPTRRALHQGHGLRWGGITD